MLLEGVELYSKTEIMLDDPYVGCVIAIIGLILSIICWVVLVSAKNKFTRRISGTIGMIGVLITLTSPLHIKERTVPTGKYEYVVTISENVSVLEFSEKYEIIEQDGKLYTIRDK